MEVFASIEGCFVVASEFNTVFDGDMSQILDSSIIFGDNVRSSIGVDAEAR